MNCEDSGPFTDKRVCAVRKGGADLLDRLRSLKRYRNKARLTVSYLNPLAVTRVSLATLTCTLCQFNQNNFH